MRGLLGSPSSTRACDGCQSALGVGCGLGLGLGVGLGLGLGIGVGVGLGSRLAGVLWY